VLDRIRLDDPTGDLADDATLTLGNAFFRREKYIRADEYYTDLRKTFPSSEHQFHAHFLGLKSKLMSYQGHDYSANSLFEGEKLVKQIRRQFPAESEQEREYLNRAAAEIQFNKAEREWQLAEHHYDRKEFGAARFYYQSILKDYGDTPFGERSSQRLRTMGGLPEVPPQRLSWLVKLFPDKENELPALTAGGAPTQLR
jgi:outer membrane protein assembly factor BamD (BamD/ComL family)